MDDLSVEVLLNENLLCKAHVLDVLADSIVVALESSSKPPFTVPFHSARVPPKPSSTAAEFKEGDDVEVCQRIESIDACAWVPMRVRMMKGDFVVIDVPDSQPPITDIVQVDSIRLPNKSPPISATTFHRLLIDVPTDLHAICQEEENHREFRQRCGASRVQFSAESHALVVLSRNEAVAKKAALLGDLHVRSLRQKMLLLQLTEESVRKLESSKQQPVRSSHHVEFVVPRDLMGLAIGSQGSNIQRARQLPGVHTVDLDEETATFTIDGESEEAVNSARELLEYTERRIQLPRDMISRIIGRNGHNIQSIVDRSGVVRVKIEGDNESPTTREEGVVPFIFVGTVEAIDNAKLLLDYHIAHLKEVDVLTRQKQQLDAELHNLSTSTYNRPTSGSSSYSPNYSGHRDDQQRGRGNYEGSRGRGRGRGNYGHTATNGKTNNVQNGPSSGEPSGTSAAVHNSGNQVLPVPVVVKAAAASGGASAAVAAPTPLTKTPNGSGSGEAVATSTNIVNGQ